MLVLSSAATANFLLFRSLPKDSRLHSHCAVEALIVTTMVEQSLSLSFQTTVPGALFSVMFLPANSTVFAVAPEEDGAIIYDIRNMKRLFYITTNLFIVFLIFIFNSIDEFHVILEMSTLFRVPMEL